MKEHDERYVAAVEKHTLNGASTTTLIKHKHSYAVLEKGKRMDSALMVLIIRDVVATSYLPELLQVPELTQGPPVFPLYL